MKQLLPVNIDLLSTTFEAATRRNDSFTAGFYEMLLERDPRAHLHFTGPVGGAQQRMLARAVVAILAHLDNPAWLLATLPPLGREHQQRGISAPEYETFVACFIETLESSCDDEWSDEAEAEWSAAFAVIKTLMLSGYEGEPEQLDKA